MVGYLAVVPCESQLHGQDYGISGAVVSFRFRVLESESDLVELSTGPSEFRLNTNLNEP